jgi:hypothetical protein
MLTRLAKFASAIMFTALLACAASSGQSATPVAQTRSSKVHGTIRLDPHDVAPKVAVTFTGENGNTTVFTDKSGFYETNLPVGFYTMAIDQVPHGFKEYRRPLFRVASSTMLIIDVTLGAGVSCDPVVPVGSKHVSSEEKAEDSCGASALFSIPSSDGIPYQLFINYPSPQRTPQGGLYRSSTFAGRKSQVRVMYNLFTLEADAVTYDENTRTLKATGNVVVENTDGSNQRVDSMTLKIENGQATLLL